MSLQTRSGRKRLLGLAVVAVALAVAAVAVVVLLDDGRGSAERLRAYAATGGLPL